MADFTGGNAGSRAESNKTSAEFENEAMSCEDLNNNSDTVSRVDHENSAGCLNVKDDSSFLQKVKLDVGESEKNDAFTEEESATVGKDGIKDKNEIFTNGAVESGKVHSANGSAPFQNGDEGIGVKDETLEEENGFLDIENNNKEVKVACDAGNEVEELGMNTHEHLAVETEKVETDYSNGRSLEREENGTHADDAEGAELEKNMNAKVELESEEEEEKAKSELASENGEVATIADADILDDVSIDSNSVRNDNSASGVGEPPKPVKEEPVKTRSWRDIAVDGMESIPDKVQFRSRNPIVRRSVPKFVKSVVRSGDLRSNTELKVCATKSIDNARSSESVNEQSSINDSTSEEKVEQTAKQKGCKLEFEAEKGHNNNGRADLFAKSKGLDIGQKNTNTSTKAGIDKEEHVKQNKRKKEKEEKVRKEEELRKKAEEEERREEEAKKERLRKEEEAAELRKKLIDEEMEKMRMAEERKKKKAEKAQKRAEYKAQKEAEEKEQKKAKKQKKKSITSDTSSVPSEINSPEKNSPDASSNDPETSRSVVLKRPVVLPSAKKKKVNVPKDPLPLPLALRNRSKRKWLKGIIWSLLVVSVVLMLFVAGNYVSYESLFQSFTF